MIRIDYCQKCSYQLQLAQLFFKMDNNSDLNIFFQEKHNETLHDHTGKEEIFRESVPYLKRGDSNHYLDQFFIKDQVEQAPPQPEPSLKSEEKVSQEQDDNFSLSDKAKFNTSSFHNFQKHLSVCLKNSIEIKAPQGQIERYHQAAVKLWKAFKNSACSTKKVLHYILGERNQHKITDAGLKECGLHKIYDEFDQKTLKDARNYLSHQTLRQIKEGRLNQYIDGKKLKDKEKFKKYVQIFVEELESGFLRKRLPRDKVIDLQRCD